MSEKPRLSITCPQGESLEDYKAWIRRAVEERTGEPAEHTMTEEVWEHTCRQVLERAGQVAPDAPSDDGDPASKDA